MTDECGCYDGPWGGDGTIVAIRCPAHDAVPPENENAVRLKRNAAGALTMNRATAQRIHLARSGPLMSTSIKSKRR